MLNRSRDLLKTWVQELRVFAAFLIIFYVVVLGASSLALALFKAHAAGSYDAIFAYTVELAKSNSVNLLLFSFLVVATAILFITVFFVNAEHKRFQASFSGRDDRGFAWASFVLTVIVSIFVGAATIGLFDNLSLFTYILENPGGLFAFITGSLSVFALFLTLRAVLEIRNSITSFSDFVVRVEKLLDETDPSDHVEFCFHTPATGCLALPSYLWRKVYDKLNTMKSKYSLVCLRDAEMTDWFNVFLLEIGGDPKRLSEMKARILEGIEASSALKFRAKGHEPIRIGNTNESEIIPGLTGTTWSGIPGTYMVVNKDHAILATPFFLPRYRQKAPLGVFNQRVEMIGFESRDKNIVDAVKIEIDRIRKHALSTDSAPETDENYEKPNMTTIEERIDACINQILTRT